MMETFVFGLTESMSAVFAGFVAAAVALVGLIIAKENKTSEFRQAWIDALRQDIGDYISATRVIAQDHMRFNAMPASHAEEVEYSIAMQNIYVSASASLARIRLRINIDDSDKALKLLNRQFLEKTTAMQEHLGGKRYIECLILSNTLHEDAGLILKREWGRVKAGEPVYRFATYGFLIMFIALSILLGYGSLVSTKAMASQPSAVPANVTEPHSGQGVAENFANSRVKK